MTGVINAGTDSGTVRPVNVGDDLEFDGFDGRAKSVAIVAPISVNGAPTLYSVVQGFSVPMIPEEGAVTFARMIVDEIDGATASAPIKPLGDLLAVACTDDGYWVRAAFEEGWTEAHFRADPRVLAVFVYTMTSDDADGEGE